MVKSELTGRGIRRKMMTEATVKANAATRFNCGFVEGMGLRTDGAASKMKTPHLAERSARDELLRRKVSFAVTHRLDVQLLFGFGVHQCGCGSRRWRADCRGAVAVDFWWRRAWVGGAPQMPGTPGCAAAAAPSSWAFARGVSQRGSSSLSSSSVCAAISMALFPTFLATTRRNCRGTSSARVVRMWAGVRCLALVLPCLWAMTTEGIGASLRRLAPHLPLCNVRRVQ
ncbi:surface protease GP63 [Trypanosoma rangeli]|uniref:Leishmanolysin-like peptidase n=1 Tax=Trypanosoma rangeli TaxID=5698 RepID=A0A3R7MYH4_TRYRA|nr:surface protease GP63 [Trypanosoma rangeli]RNE97228.1 surface protease GP63 [Trypanosoma rangeli]|eukprot:RNE97228.1 surface protease GP63 [Trypanosoma rangeli]